MHKERLTMVDQINRMITIETVSENNKNNNNQINNKNNNNDQFQDECVISSEQLQITRETRISKEKSEETKHNQSVLETGRIVQETHPRNDKELTSSDMTKNSKENKQDFNENAEAEKKAHAHKETENAVQTDTIDNAIATEKEQKIDTRLILNNKKRITVEEFTNLVREYNTYGNHTINEVEAYIINRAESPYKLKRAYQNAVRVIRTKVNSNQQ
jgi:hypothetical protein